MITQLGIESDNFFGGEHATYVPVKLVWGISGVDRARLDKWQPSDRGDAIFSAVSIVIVRYPLVSVAPYVRSNRLVSVDWYRSWGCPARLMSNSFQLFQFPSKTISVLHWK
eukprot:SAG11_NODE_6924_length_1224_cov_1.056000_2_plen_111_part_00